MGTQSAFQLDALYCEEEEVEDVETEKSSETTSLASSRLLLLEQDMLWEDEELLSLFSKEKETHNFSSDNNVETEPGLSLARTESVRWILRVSSHYEFSALTPILGINYLDRFVSGGLQFQKEKPWMIQLAAVTCLSLAAKIEETYVPLLLDLQVEDAEYVFEAKTIQRMEIFVLSTLKWRMKAVTPLSFLDHIIRRLGLKNHLHWDFFTKCESLLLSLLPDSRMVRYLPSVLATSTMLHVIGEVEACNAGDYQNQLLGVLKINEDKVKDCYQFIQQLLSHKRNFTHDLNNNNPNSPCSSCVINDPNYSHDEESSDESWGGIQHQPLIKKRRIQDLPISSI